jgi:transketolase N-terminal domain/subunit
VGANEAKWEDAAWVQAQIDQRCVDNMRMLTVDSVDTAKAGHPGLPMGLAEVGYVLWRHAMKYNPQNPNWFNRDRFVLSAGHGCLLQYICLHLAGYDSIQVHTYILTYLHTYLSSPLDFSPDSIVFSIQKTVLFFLGTLHFEDCCGKEMMMMMMMMSRVLPGIEQIEDLKQLCKLGSRTPGHPENVTTAGIEVTTGTYMCYSSQTQHPHASHFFPLV